MTTTVSGGTYNAEFTDWSLKGQDYATVRYFEAEGHRIETRSYAFTVEAQKGSNRVQGYTPAPNTRVEIELRRGGGVQATAIVTSTERMQYNVFLTGETIMQGDIVRVTPTGLTTYDLGIPELTTEEEPTNNRVVGQAPSDTILEVTLIQPATYDSWQTLTTSDADGDYVASFDEVYDWGCEEADVGACTQPRVNYHNPDGHSVWLEGAEPPAVSADASIQSRIPIS